MGTSTFVNTTYARPKISQTSKPRTDWILVGLVLGLTLFGLLMVYSAAPKLGVTADQFLVRQAMWAGVGLVGVFVLSRFNYHRLQRFTVLFMILMLGLLIATPLVGDKTFGASRSLLQGSIRASELAKLVIIIYVAVWLNAKRELLNNLSMGLVPLIAILAVTGGLIFIQPDFSAAITVVILGAIMFFLAGGAWRQIIMTVVLVIGFGAVIVLLYPKGLVRVTDYWMGLHNPLEASYHVQRSLGAIINGGLFGVGIAHGSTKFTGLPVAHTDSIFAVIAEEVGLLGAGLLIAAFLLLLWRGLKIANNAPDHFGSLLASGITVWIVVEALLNMAVMVNLLPQAGNALPFISYGGSSLTMTLAGIGILMNIARQSSGGGQSAQGGNTFGAVVDLRWRDRRRSVPRSGRSSDSRK
jgi:cell division protein FtsW